MHSFLLALTAFMPDTVILKNEKKLIAHLISFLSNRKTPLRLCYRASIHGLFSQQFHQHCDDKAGTVVLVKVGNYIFGGYTDQTWQSKNFTNSSKFLISHNFPTFYARAKTILHCNVKTLQIISVKILIQRRKHCSLTVQCYNWGKKFQVCEHEKCRNRRKAERVLFALLLYYNDSICRKS